MLPSHKVAILGISPNWMSRPRQYLAISHIAVSGLPPLRMASKLLPYQLLGSIRSA
jgi:hypothetical protein